MAMVILFIGSFVTFVIAIVVYLRSEDTAYHKAKEKILDVQVELQASLKKTIEQEIGKVQVAVEGRIDNIRETSAREFTKLDEKILILENMTKAQELEIQRLKERPPPVPQKEQRLHLTTSRPIQIEIVRPKKPVTFEKVKRQIEGLSK